MPNASMMAHAPVHWSIRPRTAASRVAMESIDDRIAKNLPAVGGTAVVRGDVVRGDACCLPPYAGRGAHTCRNHCDGAGGGSRFGQRRGRVIERGLRRQRRRTGPAPVDGDGGPVEAARRTHGGDFHGHPEQRRTPAARSAGGLQGDLGMARGRRRLALLYRQLGAFDLAAGAQATLRYPTKKTPRPAGRFLVRVSPDQAALRPASWRSTYCRMPPWRKNSRSFGVSSITCTLNCFLLPSSAVAVTVASFALPLSRPVMSKLSRPVRPSDLAFSPALNCSGSTPMPTRLERWMRSKLSVITALTPSSRVPLAAQSREEPVPYSLPAMTTSGVPVSLYFIAAS